jgi:hypothetical protein
MISLRLALAQREDRRLTGLSVRQVAPDVLGAGLNCSESRCPVRPPTVTDVLLVAPKAGMKSE